MMPARNRSAFDTMYENSPKATGSGDDVPTQEEIDIENSEVEETSEEPLTDEPESKGETTAKVVEKNGSARVANLAEKEAVLVPVSQIAPPKKDQWSTFNKRASQEMADSIRVKGLIYPVLLRPLPKSPTKVTSDGTMYEVVAGRQRLYACQTILKWDTIPAVVQAMDDEDCKMYMLIENCARKGLKPDILYAHVAEWRKLHAAKVGAADPLDLRKGRKDAAARARAGKASSKAPKTDGEASEAAPEPVKPANLQEAIAHATGTSVSTAKRTMRVAAMLDGLTEKERDVVFPNDETKQPDKGQLEAMSDLTEKSIKDTIKFVSSGMGWSAAIALGYKRPGRKIVEKAPSIEDLGDDEWLETTCESRLAQLKKKTNFKSDALLYRKFVRLRKKIHGEMEEILKFTKNAGGRGPFHLMLERAFYVNFPNEWLICGMCGGTGKAKINGDNGDMPPCNQCHGAGYKVTVTSTT